MMQTDLKINQGNVGQKSIRTSDTLFSRLLIYNDKFDLNSVT